MGVQMLREGCYFWGQVHLYFEMLRHLQAKEII